AMERASGRVTEQISDHLAAAERVVQSFEARVGAHLVQPGDPVDLQRALVAEMVTSAATEATSRPSVSEVSFTYARGEARPGGELRLDAEGRGQITVGRQRDALWGRRVFQIGEDWRAERRTLWGGPMSAE